MFKRFRNIKPGTMLSHLIITLAYPAGKAFVSDQNRLLIFTDTMTIIALILVVCGLVYASVLQGDWDLSGFVFRRGLWLGQAPKDNYRAYSADRKAAREAAFNYPLFLGLLYLAAAAVLAYGVL